MSANPHNASLGLPENGLPDNELPDNESPGNELPAGATAAPSLTAVSLGHSSSASHALGHEALQALLAFSSLHEQLRQRRAREKSGEPLDADVWQLEQFVLDEVLQLVAERALTLTGADGVAVAMAEGDAIVCRAAAGAIVPEPGARLDPKSGFSGACLRTGGIVRCDDSENDPRVNVEVCRRLGTRSIVAVPIASAHGTLGLLEAFSAEPHGFNDSDVRSLNLLAELILAAIKPEEENRLAEISQRLLAGESVEPPSRSVQPQEGAAPGKTANAGEDVGAAAPESSPEIFQEYGKKQNFTALLAAIVLLVALVLALAAGVWWKFHHSAPAKLQTSAPVATTSASAEKPPELAPPVPVPEDEAPSSTDEKHSAPTLVTGIWHVSSADSSTVIIDMKG